MNQHTLWKEIKHPQIKPGYYINEIGEVYHENSPDVITHADYHATNGYDFILLCDNTSLEQPRLFPIDDLMAMTFIPIPDELKDKRVKVSHINGDTRDNLLDNLQWVEDIEEWRVCTYPGVKPDTYEVSSWGRIRKINTEEYVKQHINGAGYLVSHLLREVINSNNRKHKTFDVHSLIIKAFSVNKNNDVCNHIDGVKTHNTNKNLEYVSTQINTKHAIYTKLKNCLSIEAISHIRDLLNTWKYPRIACQHIDYDRFPEIKPSMISNIKRGIYYNRMELINKNDFHPGKMTTDEIDMVRDAILSSENHDCNKAFSKIDHQVYPHITLQMVKEIKTNKYSSYNRSNKYDLSKLVFLRTPCPCRITVEQIDRIRDLLMTNNGSVNKVIKLIKDPNITDDMIQDIKRGKSYKRSNKYDLSKSSRYPFKKY